MMLTDVAAVVFDDIPVFELGVVCEVFGTDRSADGLPAYDFAVCAAERPPLRTSSGFLIDTPFGLERLAAADLIAIPGWRGVDQRPPDALLDALRMAVDRGACVMSICSGTFVLAEAGLLDGRRATTHWRLVKTLAERYPAIHVEPDVLYVDEGTILTSAGTSAGIDLCLHIVRRERGTAIANALARRMVVPPQREGGQRQFVESPVVDVRPGQGIADVLVWAQGRLDQKLSVNQLAARAHMSPRTFARRFLNTTGSTPHRWLLAQRLGFGQKLLETTDLGIDQLAEQVGFGTAAAFRLQFSRQFRTTPSAYRRAFRPPRER
jgi:transcriptional regulator GlxA family with amidase domain